LDSAVNRVTSGGRVLGANNSITAYQALQGVTINSAWQSREDSIKGTLTPGKVADMIILTSNPLTWSTRDELYDINVTATIKGDKLVYGSFPPQFPGWR